MYNIERIIMISGLASSIRLENSIDKVLSYIMDSNKSKLLFILLFHNISLFLMILYLVVGTNKKMHYYVVSVFFIIFAVNYANSGCPLLKLERKYLGTKQWYGGYHALELIGIKPNRDNVRALFYIWSALILVVIAVKMW